MKNISRRNFNKKLGRGLGGAALLTSFPYAGALARTSQDKESLGIALVGLGSYSTNQLAPALQDTQYCHLAGVVTGTASKEHIWAQQYKLHQDNIYNYENFDSIAGNDAIDIVYVVLPNSMHAEFCIRAAKAGKHVICEKPMAISVPVRRRGLSSPLATGCIPNPTPRK